MISKTTIDWVTTLPQKTHSFRLRDCYTCNWNKCDLSAERWCRAFLICVAKSIVQLHGIFVVSGFRRFETAQCCSWITGNVLWYTIFPYNSAPNISTVAKEMGGIFMRFAWSGEDPATFVDQAGPCWSQNCCTFVSLRCSRSSSAQVLGRSYTVGQ